MKSLILIDANALIHRGFHALPPLKSKKGELTNAVYGFSSILLKAINELKPDYMAACFDLAEPTFRHKEFEDYKATRPKTPEELCEQIPKVRNLLDVLGIESLEKAGFEADDIIGTISKKLASKNDIEVLIITGDLDTLQLVDDKIKVYTMKKGLSHTVIYDEKGVRERYGLSPDQLADLRGLKGDPSDNIPGVAGVGKKTATLLLREFKTIENLYKKLEKMKEEEIKNHSTLTPRIARLLKEDKEMAFFSKKLATIREDVPIKFNLKNFNWKKGLDIKKTKKLFEKLNFKTLINRLPGAQSQEPKQKGLFD